MIKPPVTIRRFFRHKSFTLVELIIGITLMSVVILAVISFEVVSRDIFISSERKSVLNNDVSFVLDHIQKTIWQGEGDPTNPSLQLVHGTDPLLTVRNDTMVLGTYRFEFTNNEIVYNDGTADYSLTQRLYNDTANAPFEMRLEDNGVFINNLTLMYSPTGTYHSRNNPKINMKAIYFYPYGQTAVVPGVFAVRSTMFDDGAAIPSVCEASLPVSGLCNGVNRSPQITIQNPPSGTKSFGLTMKDDAIFFCHWVVADIPGSTTQIAEGASPALMPLGSVEGRHDYGTGSGYGGPCPPVVGETHTYTFRLDAFDVDSLAPYGWDGSGGDGAYNAAVAACVADSSCNVLGTAVYTGTYTR